jgi:hypothetical protein
MGRHLLLFHSVFQLVKGTDVHVRSFFLKMIGYVRVMQHNDRNALFSVC